MSAIDASNFPLQVIIAGGAVSVLRGVRTATEDIDFYCVQESIMNTIEEAAESVAEDLKLEHGFMNSNIRLFMNHSSFDQAASRSFKQGECIFQNDVFQIYAADYGYQFISKVDRMSNAIAKGRKIMTKDRLDAVFYLHELIRIEFMGNNPTREEVVALYPSDGFMPNVLAEILDLVTQTYQEYYKAAPFA